MFNFNLQRFGGKGGYKSAPAVVTPLTPEQKRTIELQNQYLEKTAPVLSDLVSQGHAALTRYNSPDFEKYYGQGLQTAINASNMVGDLTYTYNPDLITSQRLAEGVMPSSYKAGMDAAIGEALLPYQQQFNNLANNGVINSSMGRAWAGDMAKAGTTAANLAYNQNMQTASGLAQNANQAYNQAYSGRSQLINQYGQSSTAPLSVQNAYYQSATQPAKDFLSLGTQTYQPTGQAANQAYQWQAGLSAPAQTNYVQQPGFGSVLGTLGGAATTAWCFPAGTQISTPGGDRNIEDVKVGDVVSTLCGAQEVTKTIQSVQPIVRVRTTQGELLCTETEWLLTVEGSVPVEEIEPGDVLIHKDGGATVIAVDFDVDVVPVYEIVVPWFYANGFVVDGFDPEVN